MAERILTILLIEDEPSECIAITQYADKVDGVKIIAVTNSVDQALMYARDYLPDAIILDVELRKGCGNGFMFLKKLRESDTRVMPYILVTTNNISEITYEYTRELGADFFMSKHQDDYCAGNVIDFLYSMRNAIQHRSSQVGVNKDGITTETPEELSTRLQKRVNMEMDIIGISPKMLGKQYLIDAIIYMLEKGRTMRICTEVAKMYGKSEPAIERAMQNAINKTWKSMDINHLNKHYTARISSAKGIPTLTEFVYYYAEKINNA